MILMENPKHGRMHVYSQAEAVEAEKSGWSVVKAEAPKVEVAAPIESEWAPSPVDAPKRGYNKRK